MAFKVNSEKLKAFTNRKVILGILAMFFGVIIIFVSSIFPLIIDPSAWGTAEFLSDELIIVAITISGMVAMLMVGQAYNASSPNSEISKAKVLFTTTLNSYISNYNHFFQWIKKVLQPHDQQEKNEYLLSKVGVTNFEIVELDESELKLLVQAPQKFGDKFYKKINEEQFKMIMDIKNGKTAIQFVSPQSYIIMTSIDSHKTTSEKLANQDKKKMSIVAYKVVWKVLCTLAVGMIFAALAVPEGSEGMAATASVMSKLFSRLFSFFTSGFMGYWTGCQLNDIDASYINEKSNVHKMYHDDSTFVPLTEEEEAKEEYIERVKNENKESMKELDLKSNKLPLKAKIE